MEIELPVECNSLQQQKTVAVVELWLVIQCKKCVLRNV